MFRTVINTRTYNAVETYRVMRNKLVAAFCGIAVCCVCSQGTLMSRAWAEPKQATATRSDDDVDFLIARLKQLQAPQRLAAARRLAEMGKEADAAVPALVLCLNDPSNDVRVVCAYAIARVSNDAIVGIKAILPLLADPNEHVRYSAQWSVAQLAIELPLDSEESKRLQAIDLFEKALVELQKYDHQRRHRVALESVINSLKSQKPADVTINQSAKTDNIDTEQLVSGLYEPNDFISRLMIIRRLRDDSKYSGALRQKVLIFEAAQLDGSLLDYAVGRWENLAQVELTNILSQLEMSREFSDSTHFLIERVIPTDAIMLARLKRWSLDRQLSLDVRIASVASIAKSRHDVPNCVNWLAGLLLDAELQSFAADGLARMGSAAASAQSHLMSALMKSRDESFQISGIIALPQIAPESSIAADFVVQWLKSLPNDSVLQSLLLDAITDFGQLSAAAIPNITQLLQHQDAEVRIAALRALRSMRERATVTTPALFKILASTEESIAVKNRAARVLRRLDPAVFQPVLLSLPSVQEPTIQENFLRALAVCDPTIEEAKLCLPLVDDKSAAILVRVAAVNAIGAAGTSAKPMASRLIPYCNDGEEPILQAACILAAARIDPESIREIAISHLESESITVRANAAYALHLCGMSRMAFDNLLGLLNETETDIVIREALEELGDSIATWLVDEAENADRSDAQRVACCDLACLVSQPDWSRLLKLVDDNYLGQTFANHLSYHWHPEISSSIDEHLNEIETLLTLHQSPKISAIGKARLVSLLIPDGLGAADDEGEWSVPALTKSAAIELLVRNDDVSASTASASVPSMTAPSMAAPSMAAPGMSPPKRKTSPGPTGISQGEAMPPDSPVAADTVGDIAKELSDRDRLIAPAMPTPSPEVLASDDKKSIKEVEVFYGTNRQRDFTGYSMREIVTAILVATIGSVLTLAFCAFGSFSSGGRILGILAIAGLGIFGSFGIFAAKQLSSYPVQAVVAYNHQVADRIEYGKCTVTLPPNHQPGMVEAPILLKGQFLSDPNQHVVLKQIEQLSHDDFLVDIQEAQTRKGKNLLVFIHGYNVSFDDAAKRTAQMSFDLDFPGAAIFYSWPSQANWYGYKADQQRIELSVKQIRRFLEDLAEKSGAETINLVAHSMGNLGLTEALKQINTPTGQPIFNQVVLAAPDVDAEVFRNEIAPHIVTKAKRTTLYTSKTDLALIASRYFNQGARLGDSGPEVVTYPGIDTIDATTIDSSLLGHSYYGSNITVLTDVGHLLRDEPLAQRVYLRPIEDSGVSYWTFDPVLVSKLQADMTIKK